MTFVRNFSYDLPVTDFPPFIQQLQGRLNDPLPGLAVQMEMSSKPERADYPIRDDHRKSAVLALLYPHSERHHLVFMQRPVYPGVHSGQVSFPGGRQEPEDRDLTATALREAEEELGIPARQVQVIGALTPLYIPPSNFMVYPQVGYMPVRPDFVPSEREVEQVIEVSLELLLDTEIRQESTIRLNQDLEIKAPAFVVEGFPIWGATAMMLNELLHIIQRIDKR